MQWWFDAYNVNADSSPDAINDQTAFFNWNDMSQNNRNAVQERLTRWPFTKRMLLAARPRSSLTPQTPWTCLPHRDQDGLCRDEAGFDTIGRDLAFGGDLVGTTSGGKWGIKRSGVAMLDSAVASNAWAVIVYKASAGDYAIYANGVEKVTCTDVTGISALDKIGGTFKGEIAEVVVYDRVLPNLAREKIEAYLAHKWGLQSLLPTTHNTPLPCLLLVGLRKSPSNPCRTRRR